MNIKFYDGDCILRTKYNNQSFTQYLKHLKDLTNHRCDSKSCRLKYLDFENEWVTFDTDNELQEAIKYATSIQTTLKMKFGNCTESKKIDFSQVPSAHYVCDVNYPDGSKVKAGIPITKTWMYSNDGDAQWPDGIMLVCEKDSKSKVDAYHKATISPCNPSKGELTKISLVVNFDKKYVGKRIKNIYQLVTPRRSSFWP
ncbi:zgc [Acrasis kona]|uniref:Zgc n=1 Tax=Acrasis kona TaxID=1008807 RepID=A0AAW2Z8N7_9EUKA